jgi:FkbM family methyltransferase
VRTERVETPFGVFTCFVDDLATEQLKQYGAHQRRDLAALLSLVRQGDTVVDVGAHIGTFTVPLARAVGPTGRVIAFEPIPKNFEVLTENVEQNGLARTVTLVQTAVSDRSLGLKAVPFTGNTGGVHLVEGGDLECITLDSFELEKVDLIKIDVEGMEHQVLTGGAELIGRCCPVISFEVNRLLDVSLRPLSQFFRGQRYRFVTNLSGRNAPDDCFELAWLGGVSRFGLVGLPPLLDIIAINASSPRWPHLSYLGSRIAWMKRLTARLLST